MEALVNRKIIFSYFFLLVFLIILTGHRNISFSHKSASSRDAILDPRKVADTVVTWILQIQYIDIFLLLVIGEPQRSVHFRCRIH